MSLLPEIGRISSVSGGSILAGVMATRWTRLDFTQGEASNFQREIVDPIWRFCSRNVDTRAVFTSVVFGNRLPLWYQKHLVGQATLQDLPDYPAFVFNAAHLETGRNWHFTKALMRTYRLGIIDNPNTPLAQVMAASSALPPYFPPVVLELQPDDFRQSEYADRFDRRDLKEKVSLADGALYDNLGIHSIQDFKTVLVSDASAPLETEWRGPSLLRALNNRSKRPIDIAVEQTMALRRRTIVGQLDAKEKKGAFWSIKTPLARYPKESPFAGAELHRPYLESIRTRLNSFTDEEKGWLINWGYIQCDLSVRSYYRPDLPPPSTLPLPTYALAADVQKPRSKPPPTP